MKGVYITRKKDNSIYYRVSLTFKGKHISLGSYDDEKAANLAYEEGKQVIELALTPDDYKPSMVIYHDKFIVLSNFVTNGIYFATPIFLRKQYFEYYLSETTILKFDRDDLFFYASHKIQKKGGYLFVSDYGSQYKILSRYGIKPFAVYERDFIMVNGDKNDYRYSNIKIINNYTGVIAKTASGKTVYEALVHINGNYIIGRYDDEITAAIAYNKAVDYLKANGIKKSFIKNYIISYKKEQYDEAYKKIKIKNTIKAIRPEDVK